MRKDPTEFRKRFAAWKNGKMPYENGLPKNVKKFKDGKLPGYAIGTPDNEEVSDATYVQRPMIVRPIKRNFIAEAQKRHAAEAVGPDTRSSYQRKQSQAEKQYANQQYQKAKDDAKRAEGLEQMMKTISPSTYIEAATDQDLGAAGRFVTDAAVFGLPSMLKYGISKALSTPIFGKWVYNIPENTNMAYRIMGPLERDWLMQGNELSTRATNIATKAEEVAARTKGRFNIYKAGAEHGGRKQFAKGQPWHANTTTHGEKQVLAIPGEDLPWISGKHYNGPQGYGWGVGDVSFDEVPFGSHIDLMTDEAGFSGINPSQLPGSVIYSPFHIFGKKLGYKVLYPKPL